MSKEDWIAEARIAAAQCWCTEETRGKMRTEEDAVEPAIVEELTPEELKAVKKFNARSGCGYPEAPCDFCAVFLNGLRGQPFPDYEDRDIKYAFKAGSRARRRLFPIGK